MVKQPWRAVRSATLRTLCLTADNRDAPWILYEAGALSKMRSVSRVCPLLCGRAQSEVEKPLQQFQATDFHQKEMLELVETMNRALGQGGSDGTELSDRFRKHWPDLEKHVSERTKGAHPAAGIYRRFDGNGYAGTVTLHGDGSVTSLEGARKDKYRWEVKQDVLWLYFANSTWAFEPMEPGILVGTSRRGRSKGETAWLVFSRRAG